VTIHDRDNLTATVFAALYPEYDLVIVGATYFVYPPHTLGGPLMFIANSLGAIARQIADASFSTSS
jgi:hypothetical protein